MNKRHFLSGNEAIAQAVRLCRPRVVAAYPITPQTVVVERLAQMVEAGELDAQFVHVESEHSALSLLMGSAAMGVRTFTATSSQGLLYMAECLYYSAGGRWPLVMMNANRALALPWNIYGDQSDSLGLISCGWIQAYAESAQESLDMIIQAYALAEDPVIRTPVLVNLDGFLLTHTYEPVDVPDQADVDVFLPSGDLPEGYPGTFSLSQPRSLGITAGPDDYIAFKYGQHRDMLHALERVGALVKAFAQYFGRHHGGLTQAYQLKDAQLVIITLGSISGTVRAAVDAMREQGIAAGMLRLRYLRPFPAAEIREALFGSRRTVSVAALGILEKDISFGYQGSVCIEVKAALYEQGLQGVLPPVLNLVAGLGGQAIDKSDICNLFEDLAALAMNKDSRAPLQFLSMEGSL